jgi:hypothetical protein
MTTNPFYALLLTAAFVAGIFLLLAVLSRLDPTTRRPPPTHRASGTVKRSVDDPAGETSTP